MVKTFEVLLVVLYLLYCSPNLCIIILRAHHDHNKIAPCGMIKVKKKNELNNETVVLRQFVLLELVSSSSSIYLFLNW